VDPGGDGGGGLTATLFCGSCGAQSSPTAKFCGECGTRLAQATQSAEYKQVTVLFADVVHSMDLAATLDMERWREIMTELAERSAAVARRYGGTVEFTGERCDGDFRRPGCVGGSRFSGVPGRPGHPGGDQPAGGAGGPPRTVWRCGCGWA
jgi:adenylate cyclase